MTVKKATHPRTSKSENFGTGLFSGFPRGYGVRDSNHSQGQMGTQIVMVQN